MKEVVFSFPLVINEMPTIEWVEQHILKNNIIVIKRFDFFKKLGFKIAMNIYNRTRLCEEQNWKCCWCGNLMTERRNLKFSATIEHIVPASRGGENSIDNYASACERCNTARGTKSIENFMEVVEKGFPSVFTSSTSRQKSENDKQIVAEAFKNNPTDNPFDPDSKRDRMFRKLQNSKYTNIADSHTNYNDLRIDALTALISNKSLNPFAEDDVRHAMYAAFQRFSEETLRKLHLSALVKKGPIKIKAKKPKRRKCGPQHGGNRGRKKSIEQVAA